MADTAPRCNSLVPKGMVGSCAHQSRPYTGGGAEGPAVRVDGLIDAAQDRLSARLLRHERHEVVDGIAAVLDEQSYVDL